MIPRQRHPLARPPVRPPARPRITMPRFTPEQRQRIAAAVDALLKRVRAAFELLRRAAQAAAQALAAAAKAVAPLAQQLAQARTDRPAWASPYGPAPRRARR